MSSDKYNKYDFLAMNFSKKEYSDCGGYLNYRYFICNTIGPQFQIGDTLADFGCGDGAFTEICLNHSLKVHAFDNSEGMISQININLKNFINNRKLNTYIFDINQIDQLPIVSVDHIVATMRTFFYYCHNNIDVLKLFYKICNKKIIIDFNPRVLSESTVKKLLSEAGFDKVYIVGFFYPQTKVLPKFLINLLHFFSKIRFFRFLICFFKFNSIAIAVK